MRVLPLLASWLPFALAWDSSVSYDNGQWTPTPTQQYYSSSQQQQQWTPTPTPTYYSTWYPVVNTVWSTTTYCYTYPTTIITVTSVIPCPVTSYTTTYVCDSCETTPEPCDQCEPTTSTQCDECEPTTDYTTVYAGGGGTTTTPNQPVVSTLSSYTQNGVIVVVVTTLYPAASQTTTNVAQSNVQVIYASHAEIARVIGGTAGMVLWTICAAMVGVAMVQL